LEELKSENGASSRVLIGFNGVAIRYINAYVKEAWRKAEYSKLTPYLRERVI